MNKGRMGGGGFNNENCKNIGFQYFTNILSFRIYINENINPEAHLIFRSHF